MTTILPPVPRLIFTIIEPITLLLGALAPLRDAPGFVTSQLAREKPHSLLPTEHILVLQLGSLYFLLCLLGVLVLNTTTEARVVHVYIFALWFADITHLAATGYVSGFDAVVDWRSWNATAWGNIGITAALFVFRSAYLLGLFGPDRPPVARARKAR